MVCTGCSSIHFFFFFFFFFFTFLNCNGVLIQIIIHNPFCTECNIITYIRRTFMHIQLTFPVLLVKKKKIVFEF